MQNKANLPDTQMNASYVKTKTYEQKPMDNKPTKQTQSKPISSTSAADRLRRLDASLLQKCRILKMFHFVLTGKISFVNLLLIEQRYIKKGGQNGC